MEGPAGLEVVNAPESGVWRIARSPDPLAASPPLKSDELDRPGAGNRFDSALGSYRVLYFASALECCFGETLARFRPDPQLAALLDGDPEQAGFMGVGNVPADWRYRREVVQVALPDDALFVDVEHRRTRARLRHRMADVMAHLGVSDLDVPAVRGGDRRLTRWISQRIYEWEEPSGEFPFAGIRYSSRLDSDWEAWAVFIDGYTTFRVLERTPIRGKMPALLSVSHDFNLIVH